MNEWKPNAPELSKEFNRTPDPEPPRRTVSKAEAEMLERFLKKPVPELVLRMRGAIGASSTREANEAVEKRYAYVLERLAARKHKARTDLQLANF
jgi:hypothetical protein